MCMGDVKPDAKQQGQVRRADEQRQIINFLIMTGIDK